MKSVLVTLIFAFAMFGNATLLKRAGVQGPTMSLAQINQTPLGSQILSLAQLQMKAQGTVNSIADLLQEIYNDLDNQRIANEKQHEQDEAYCNENDARLVEELETASDNFLAQQNVRDTAVNNLAQLRPKLQDIQDELARDRQALSDGQAQRDRQHNTYLNDVKENSDAIAACGEALKLLNSLLGGSSFIQLKDRFAKVSAQMEATKPTSHAHIYGPIIRALAQITTKADPAAIKRIVELIENLSDQLKAALQTIEADEAQQAEDWAALRAQLEKEIRDGEASEKQTQKLIAENESTRDNAQERMHQLELQIESVSHELKTLRNDCEVKRREYERRKNGIAGELAIMEKLIEHFANSSVEIQDFLTGAPEGGEAF